SIVIHGPASASEPTRGTPPNDPTIATSSCPEQDATSPPAGLGATETESPCGIDNGRGLHGPGPDQIAEVGLMNPHRTSFALQKMPDGKVFAFGGEITDGFGETTDRIE